MRRSLLMPKLGLTMTEGLLVEWSRAPGQRFERDQTVFVVETEKTANDVGAEAAGVLLEVVHAAGTTVPVGEVIGYWDDGAQAQAPPASEEIPASTRVVATPLARREAVRRDVDLSQLAGSGPSGRINVQDVLAAAGSPSPAAGATRANRVQPGRIALATANRLLQSKQQIPHFYLAREADVRSLLTLREDLKAHAGFNPTVHHFLLAAAGRALHDQPEATRVWDNGAFLQLGGSDVGMAVHCEQGLLVPVARGAGQRALADIAKDAQELVARARTGRLQAEESGGAAITVSNAGMFDVSYMTPIINPGEAMILGVGSVRELFRPDARGRPELRREIGLVLACDHRVHDGVSGLRLLGRIVHYLEHPALLLLPPA